MKTAERSHVLVVGATGLIGTEVVRHLGSAGYAVRGVTHETTPRLDITDLASIEAFFAGAPPVDHVVIAAGDARFGALETLTEADFAAGLRSKLMGQVDVARVALRHLPGGGSVTLTSGELSTTPIPGSAAVALVNGAIDAFVRAAALDVRTGARINAVSPGWLSETLRRLGREPSAGLPARVVANLYRAAIESDAAGRIFTAADLSPEVRDDAA